MCRWLGYFGNPMRPDWLLYRTPRGLIDQSYEAREMERPINADGFGMGWYAANGEPPGLYRNVAPAWSDRNLRELAVHIETPLFLAHVRASTGSPVQQTNCHPFRHGRWLFVHNGYVAGYELLHRELLFAVDPELFGSIEGTTDSELLFHLALTFGLEEEPLPALERMAGFVEERGYARGIESPLQMTVGISDGERLYAVRYASATTANTLYVSGCVDDLKRMYPEVPEVQGLSEEARAVVSEPLSELPGTWHEVPAATALIVQPGADEEVPFVPRAPRDGGRRSPP
jgi:predicted glutamine amidotransferase